LVNSIAQGRYFDIDIAHPAYWRTMTLTTILLPFTVLVLLILIFYVRRLYLRNREFREKIEAQQNLVVLGTAASTLAHEIKNPLLSIRLQTGILEKLGDENGKDEVRIINQEIDRLSSLVYRVNDYLREPEGIKKVFNLSNLLAETSRRIWGEDLLISGSHRDALIFADEDRIRSVLENIFRNALESGSPVEGLGVSVMKNGEGQGITIRIFDRGKGIDEKNLKHIFDPFFTSKSTGTGIGLAVSKRFTEAAGGSISAENRDGGGLMVSLVFPGYTEGGTE
jgi:two-component system sensor histidine kinase HydH